MVHQPMINQLYYEIYHCYCLLHSGSQACINITYDNDGNFLGYFALIGPNDVANLIIHKNSRYHSLCFVEVSDHQTNDNQVAEPARPVD